MIQILLCSALGTSGSGVLWGDTLYTPVAHSEYSAVRVPPSVSWPMNTQAANHKDNIADLALNVDENQNMAGISCGSCWAWSITSAIEARVSQQHGHEVSLSTQQLMDCTRGVEFGGNLGQLSNSGCDGGYTEATLQWLKMTKFSLCTADKYPYTGQDSTCATCLGKVEVRNFEVYPRLIKEPSGVYHTAQATEQRLEQMVTQGPTIAIISIPNVTAFASGDTGSTQCIAPNQNTNEQPPLHSLVVYGYTNTHWLVYNSYGNGWGPNGDGTAQILRGVDAYCIGSLKLARVSDVHFMEAGKTSEPTTAQVHLSVSHNYVLEHDKVHSHALHTHDDMEGGWWLLIIFVCPLLLIFCVNAWWTDPMADYRVRYNNLAHGC